MQPTPVMLAVRLMLTVRLPLKATLMVAMILQVLMRLPTWTSKKVLLTVVATGRA